MIDLNEYEKIKVDTFTCTGCVGEEDFKFCLAVRMQGQFCVEKTIWIKKC